jgi:hypothetical protein
LSRIDLIGSQYPDLRGRAGNDRRPWDRVEEGFPDHMSLNAIRAKEVFDLVGLCLMFCDENLEHDVLQGRSN